MSETRRVRLWEVRSTEKATEYSTMPKGDPCGRTLWIPRSQVKHVSKDPAKPGEWRPCTVTLEAWLADKEDL